MQNSGNEVDQLFAILAGELKKNEIATLDDLKDVIQNAPIDPKPVVQNQWFTWDWKSKVEPHLNPLENHSFVNSFSVTKEAGEVRLRYKRLPQSPEYGPPMGIKILKSRVNSGPIPVADFRIESLELDKVIRSLQPYFSTLNMESRMSVVTKWEALKKTLEALPSKKSILRKMNLTSLPRQTEQLDVSDDVEEPLRHVKGVFFEAIVEEGDIESDIGVDMDVCVYTKMKRKRPWVGRVTELKDRETFSMNWYERDTSSKCGKFVAMKNENGSLYVTDLDVASVMFWAFTEARDEGSFIITPYWQDCLKREYKRMDQDT